MAGLREDPDVQLMLRLQQGDRSALRPLLERNHQRVLNLAYRYLGDRNHAEDVVQETFLRLYRARARYRPDAPFQAYLLRISTNICLSRLRRKAPLPLSSPPEPTEEERSPEPADPRAVQPGESLLGGELRERVRAAVAELPDRQRLAIMLNKFEGLDYQEVAVQMGLSLPATKSLLHRARMALKEALAVYLGEAT
jgi:RNA polymerase sigma-70 factor (ECF subfamily)